MRKNVKKIVGITLGVALVSVLVMKLGGNKQIAEKLVFQNDSAAPVAVKVDTLQWKPLQAERLFSGTFEPNREAKLSMELPGKITELLVDVGSNVFKGDRLLQIDRKLLQLQLEAAEVQVMGLEADVNRFAILAQADAIQGVQYEKALLGLKSAQIQRDMLQEQVNKTTLLAPFDGVITAKLSEKGAYAVPGLPLLQLTELTTLRFTILVSENDLSLFKLNATYPLQATAFEELPLHGQLISVGSKSNRANSFPLQFEVKNTPESGIKAGMFGKVILTTSDELKGMVLPAVALQGSSEQPQVYRISAGKAVLTKVKISERYNDRIVISEGLDVGDVVITAGFINLYDGAPVLVQ